MSGELFTQHILGLCHNVFGAEAKLLQQRSGRAGVTEHVVDTDALDRRGQLFAEQGADRFTQTADDVVLLHGDDLAALLGSFQHQRLIQGLDGCHVDNHGINAFFCQLLAGFDGFRHQDAVGDDGNVLALPQHFTLADFKVVALLWNTGVAARPKRI